MIRAQAICRWLTLSRLRVSTCTLAIIAIVPHVDGEVLPFPVVRPPWNYKSRVSTPPPVLLGSLPLPTLVAEIGPAINAGISFGDTDHDGKYEVIVRTAIGLPNYLIMEDQGNDTYTAEFEGESLIPYVTGDLDLDGNAEIIGQRGVNVKVYESLDSLSHPSTLVWTSPSMSNFTGFTTVGDSDRDGRMEIIHSESGGIARIHIFENAGDNTYSEVFVGTLPKSSFTGEKVIADLDGDGLIEIATIGLDGWVYVFESPADNVWQLTFSDSTGMQAAIAAEGGVDSDGNGKVELFVMGLVFTEVSVEWTTFVYEAVQNDSFVIVDSFQVTEPFTGLTHNALGDIDGDGVAEYMMDTKAGLWIYQATSPGQWDLVSSIPDPTLNKAHAEVFTYDVNQNGKTEIIWASGPATLIYEFLTTSDTGPMTRSNRLPLSISPNPCRLNATVSIPDVPREASSLAVYNVAGRLVERRFIPPGKTFTWSTRSLPAGTYFMRLEDEKRRILNTGRAVVVK